MKVVTREEALAQGLKRYFTGEPCANGHVAERYVKGAPRGKHGGCVECTRANNQRRYKEDPDYIPRWRREHPDAHAEANRRAYAHDPERVRTATAIWQWRREHPGEASGSSPFALRNLMRREHATMKHETTAGDPTIGLPDDVRAVPALTDDEQRMLAEICS